ncbi:bifunctional pyr operon transcriptional regulator/uracil phosphoribosyltransferase PyrR [Thiovibrio frasassiensis]|jgi:pyrimidine operon attenuation protein/uracil phosphoribosyltransferase|uniref:Bifunctional protein PyrR n=1 Tax=Thiovibrio frasassiensis TaxID=2984131 RepID=A0A9X4MJ54_9BACT|nr:bifunctional pyr operon transcriptional regulator/uracil phosphoribosyltransferase PyrR [Thiovibrio frasassiensis]MDG4476920.1 bifunctional pyr operon transcriptional regulator/uracil phosphoribosyltransferase PyrR [Thiovibrio frasassiensis]
MEKRIMTAEDIDRSLHRIALQIVENNHGVANLAIIGIHTGGVFLADRIQKLIQDREKIELPTGTLDITLYRDDWSLASQNPIVKKTSISFPMEEMVVVLVDDVIFTGRTIRAAMDALMDIGRPLRIQLAVLVDRGGRELPIQPDYVGMDIPVKVDEHIHVRLAEKSGADEIVLVDRN